MSVIGIGGTGVNLPLPVNNYGNQPWGGSTRLSLVGGQRHIIPAGVWLISPGQVSQVQYLDPISGLWLPLGTWSQQGLMVVNSDGVNYSVFNPTGTPVGAVVTDNGSGFTSVPTVVASTGSSAWSAIVGGAVSTTVSVTAAGSGYTYAPVLEFQAPPAGGLQATGHALISGGTISSVIVDNQGAGYLSAPSIYVRTHPQDPSSTITIGSAAAALTGSGTVTAVLLQNPGTPLTAAPTLTISGGGGSGATATAIMCLAVTSASISSSGAGYAGSAAQIATLGGMVIATPSITNPLNGASYFTPRPAQIYAPISSNTVGTPTIVDCGLFQVAPTPAVLAELATTAAVGTLTMGSITDYIYTQQTG